MNKTITGHKGGSKKPRQPVEMPDSVRSIARAKILLALGEGEFDGGVDGRSIYLDDTPLLAADGSVNFPGVTWEFRPGSVDQEHIAGVPAVENELAVGVELKSDAPWVRAVNNTQLSAVRLRLSWPAIQRQQENGDVVGYRIETSPQSAEIPELWHAVMRDERWGRLIAKAAQGAWNYGICIHPDDMPDGRMDYMIAFDYDGHSPLEADTERFTIPAARYAVFLARNGPQDGALNIREVWTRIYAQWFPQSSYLYDGDKPDFEVYDDKGNVEIFIPIVEK